MLTAELQRDADPAAPADYDKILNEQIKAWDAQISGELEKLLRFPPHHAGHFEKLKGFHANGQMPFERCVFIMTKYPDGKDANKDKELETVIEAVRAAVTRCKHFPRLASEKEVHPLIWQNVELFLLGFGKGIAIVEDRYKPELNPNVAMEWGWMRAMDKPVLYLMEDKFDHARADLSGYQDHKFTWEEPAKGIDVHVTHWLKE
jgi:hypothetical protein